MWLISLLHRAVIVGCPAWQGAKRNGADMERELEVAVKAPAVIMLAAWGLL